MKGRMLKIAKAQHLDSKEEILQYELQHSWPDENECYSIHTCWLGN